MIKLRHLFLALVLCLVFVYAAQAVDINVEWDASSGAVVGYNISTTAIVPMMTAEELAFPVWELKSTVLAPLTTTSIDVPATGLFLIRASAYNNIGEAIGTYTGVWYNGAWVLAPAPVELRSPGE